MCSYDFGYVDRSRRRPVRRGRFCDYCKCTACGKGVDRDENCLIIRVRCKDGTHVCLDCLNKMCPDRAAADDNDFCASVNHSKTPTGRSFPQCSHRPDVAPQAFDKAFWRWTHSGKHGYLERLVPFKDGDDVQI